MASVFVVPDIGADDTDRTEKVNGDPGAVGAK
jgi:hypothetical protein